MLRSFLAGRTLLSKGCCVSRRVLSLEQSEGRAAMVVAELLFRQLIVPKVYLHAAWPRRTREVDVLAIDRAGTGDIHVAEVRFGMHNASVAIEQLMHTPAHFKYLAIVGSGNYRVSEALLYSPDGFGRVGVIQISEGKDHNLHAVEMVAPERFRLGPAYIRGADRFVSSHRPDLEIRS